MKILFLDQSGQLGGAELCLTEIAKPYRDRCLVCLFTDGPFRQALEQEHIPVQILATQPLQVRKDSGWVQGISSLRQLLPLVARVVQLSREFDLIYANTQKALVVGALASLISRRPLVYHLHDILSLEHFSPTNRQLAVTLANRCASRVFATSEAAQAAFIQAGGCPERVEVVYNGFDPTLYQCDRAQTERIKQELGLQSKFLVGHFSRLSPWKGQHVLLKALQYCAEDVTAIFVGDALYGEQAYAQELHSQVAELGLQERARFLGFRYDVVPLMYACDAIAHTSIAPEPFGRVIAEAMLCERPVIAAQAGGAVELIEPGVTGLLVPPEDSETLASAINFCRKQQEWVRAIAQKAKIQASQRFHQNAINRQIAHLLDQIPIHTQSKPKAREHLKEPQSLIPPNPLNKGG
ncbi:MAG: glycosyltransferase family 4 protein [Leptolyngbyaceae cyanobacterium RU_5_1]|nr:glycosyltransferase family 4 protein [Leptolyngbyaceae cyanobacterium RU_5_1]